MTVSHPLHAGTRALRCGFVAFALALSACSTNAPDPLAATWTDLDSGVEASLRGVSVVSPDVVWVSGAHGTVLRSVDGGASFARLTLPDSDLLDFRSIHAFDRDRALIASAGSPARVYRTVDGGESWTLVHADDRPQIFLDGIAFADDQHGFLIGDPIDGRFVALATGDCGATWHELDRLPPAGRGEALFAASNGALTARGRDVRIATGGSVARVLWSEDEGASWTWARTPMSAGRPSAGCFAVAFADRLLGTLVGGDYLQPNERAGTAAFTVDGGRTWLPAESLPRGYCSAVAIADGFGAGVRVAVGPLGTEVSRDGGRHWAPLDDAPHHAIAFASGAAVGFAVGSGGRVSRFAAR